MNSELGLHRCAELARVTKRFLFILCGKLYFGSDSPSHSSVVSVTLFLLRIHCAQCSRLHALDAVVLHIVARLEGAKG